MCVLGTLNAIPFDKQIYFCLKVQKLSGNFWNLKSRSLKFQFKMAAKKLIREIPIQNIAQILLLLEKSQFMFSL